MGGVSPVTAMDSLLRQFVKSFSWQASPDLGVFFSVKWSFRQERASGLAECRPGLWMSEKSTWTGRGTSVLAGVQVLRLPEVREVPMVIQDFYCVLCAFQNVSPLFLGLGRRTGVSLS